MKRLTIALTLIISFIVTSDALTYRQSASFLKGGNTTTDTVTITPSERIMAMHVIMCARASRGVANFVRASYTSYEQFSDAQFVEFYTRGMNSGLQRSVMSTI